MSDPPPLIWEPVAEDQSQSDESWELEPEANEIDSSSQSFEWKYIGTEEKKIIPESKQESNLYLAPPTNLEEAEILLRNIPLQPRDYRTLLNLSYTVPTANTLGARVALKNEYSLTFQSFKWNRESKLCNQLDLGLTNTLQTLGFTPRQTTH